MKNLHRLHLSIKLAAYDEPDRDSYATQSTRYRVENRINKATTSALSAKNLGTLGAGLVAGKAVHKMSAGAADKTLPLRKQTFRNVATLGAGLYAAKKARDFMSSRQNKGAV